MKVKNKKYLINYISALFMILYGCSIPQRKAFEKSMKFPDSLFNSQDYVGAETSYVSELKRILTTLNGNGKNLDYSLLKYFPSISANNISYFIKSRKSNKFEFLIKYEDLLIGENDQWKRLIDVIKEKKKQDILNLKDKLEAVYNKDQDIRKDIQSIIEEKGYPSREADSVFKEIHITDSLNLIYVRVILDSYGWVGANKVGNKANSALFLVIQHADMETRKHYLPLMREAVFERKASPKEFAKLEDRVALETGKKQIYGTQIGRDQITGRYFLFPLIDSLNVDTRRSKMGLDSIRKFLINWQIIKS